MSRWREGGREEGKEELEEKRTSGREGDAGGEDSREGKGGWLKYERGRAQAEGITSGMRRRRRGRGRVKYEGREEEAGEKRAGG